MPTIIWRLGMSSWISPVRITQWISHLPFWTLNYYYEDSFHLGFPSQNSQMMKNTKLKQTGSRWERKQSVNPRGNSRSVYRWDNTPAFPKIIMIYTFWNVAVLIWIHEINEWLRLKVWKLFLNFLLSNGERVFSKFHE